jgi:hypothetical protein
MLRTLSQFQEGSQTLHGCIKYLETLLGQLQTADQSWKDRFCELWSELQYTYDQCVERQSGLLNEEYARVIAVAREMEAMVLAARAWYEEEKQALRLIVENHRPDLLGDLDAGLRSGFSGKQIR